MTLHETNHGIGAFAPYTATSPAGRPDPEPPKGRRLLAVGGVVVALVVTGALGAGAGYVAGDDAAAVRDLESAAEALEHEIEERDGDLDDARADLDSAVADLAARETVLSECVAATTSFATLLASVDEMSAAYDAVMAAAIGSAEETDAFFALDDATRDVFSVARSVKVDTNACSAGAAE